MLQVGNPDRIGAMGAWGRRMISWGIALGALFLVPAQARDSKWVSNPKDNSISFDEAWPDDPQKEPNCCWAPHAYLQGLKMYMTPVWFRGRIDASSSFRFAGIDLDGPLRDTLPKIMANGVKVDFGQFNRLTYDGTFTIASGVVQGLQLTRTFFTTYNQWAGYQELRFHNASAAPIKLDVAAQDTIWDTASGAKYMGPPRWKLGWHLPAASLTLAPGADTSLPILYFAYRAAENPPALDFAQEKATWMAFCHRIYNDHLRLETPDTDLNVTFALQKLRVAMMPCTTYVGPVATTGDGYAPGLWANDNIEYFLSLAPFIGDSVLNVSAVNNMLVWQNEMQKRLRIVYGSYEGPNLGQKMYNRGDDAMMLNAAPLAILGLGDTATAKKLWWLIATTQRCMLVNTDPTGLVHSCDDEGEGRWTTGPVLRGQDSCQQKNAQVSTNAMAYAGYINAANLAKSLGYADTAAQFLQRSQNLGQVIENFFGADIDGYHTYRFHAGLNELRGWMGHPLNCGIYTRRQGTLDALFSPTMWDSSFGVKVASTDKDWGGWYRQTTYVLRAAFASGDEDRGLTMLRGWVHKNLLGLNNAPNIREDGVIASAPLIYTRIFTEGLFGMKAVGLSSMECTPRLPKAWPSMAFRHVKLFKKDFDVEVKRVGSDLNLKIISGGETMVDKTSAPGTTYTVDLATATATTRIGAPLGQAAREDPELRAYDLRGKLLYRGDPEGWDKLRKRQRPGLYLLSRPGAFKPSMVRLWD